MVICSNFIDDFSPSLCHNVLKCYLIETRYPVLKKLNQAIDRFCILHPNFGIPNLMLYVVIGNVVLGLLSNFSSGNFLGFFSYTLSGLLHGQVIRCKLGRTPLPLERRADPVVEIAGDEKVERTRALRDEDKGDEPPHLTVEKTRKCCCFSFSPSA